MISLANVARLLSLLVDIFIDFLLFFTTLFVRWDLNGVNIRSKSYCVDYDKKEEMIVNDENHIEVAKIEDVQNGKMKRVQINEKEILIANINGKYFAIDNKCGHSNAALSCGILNGNIVTCPLHGAQFDVATGKKIKDPDFEKLPSSPPSSSFEKLPDDMKKYLQYAFSLVRDIKTHDQERYSVIVDTGSIKIGI